MANQFKKAFKGVDAAIKQGTARALNRALSSTRTKAVREIREATGLKTELIQKRTFSERAKSSILNVSFNILTKIGIELRAFNPKAKTVKVKHANRKGKAQAHQGVTVKIGKQPRQLAPGAFFLQGKSVEAVIGRKDAFVNGKYIGKGHDFPTVELRTKVFSETAEAIAKPAQKHMSDTFQRIAQHEIEFAIQRKFRDNK